MRKQLLAGLGLFCVWGTALAQRYQDTDVGEPVDRITGAGITVAGLVMLVMLLLFHYNKACHDWAEDRAGLAVCALIGVPLLVSWLLV